MNLKILPRSLEEIILSYILPIEYQKRHKKKMLKVLLSFSTIARSNYSFKRYNNTPLYTKIFWIDLSKYKYLLKPNANILYTDHIGPIDDIVIEYFNHDISRILEHTKIIMESKNLRNRNFGYLGSNYQVSSLVGERYK